MRRRTTSWTPLASEADEPHRAAARAYSAYLNMPVVPVSGGGQADPRDDAGSYTRASRGAAPRGARGVGAGARGPRMRLPARFSLHDSLGALFMRCRQHSRVPCHTILSCGERGIACGILQGQSYRRFLPPTGGRKALHSHRPKRCRRVKKYTIYKHVYKPIRNKSGRSTSAAPSVPPTPRAPTLGIHDRNRPAVSHTPSMPPDAASRVHTADLYVLPAPSTSHALPRRGARRAAAPPACFYVRGGGAAARKRSAVPVPALSLRLSRRTDRSCGSSGAAPEQSQA